MAISAGPAPDEVQAAKLRVRERVWALLEQVGQRSFQVEADAVVGVSRPISEYRIWGVPLRCPSEIPPEKLGAMTRTGRSASMTRRRSSARIASTFAGTPA